MDPVSLAPEPQSDMENRLEGNLEVVFLFESQVVAINDVIASDETHYGMLEWLWSMMLLGETT